MTRKADAVSTELETNASKLEYLQENLSIVAQKYQQDCQELERERSGCQTLRADLNNRIAHFASSEGRQKRMRQELEWEIERLETLMEAQRREHANQIAVAQDDIDELRQRHRDEMTQLAKSLASVEAERDAVTIELELLSGQEETREKEFALHQGNLFSKKQSLQEERDLLIDEKLTLEERIVSLVDAKTIIKKRYDALVKDKRSLREDLACATDRAEQSETQILQYRREKLAEDEDREKMSVLMDDLEVQTARIETREEELKQQEASLKLQVCETSAQVADIEDREQQAAHVTRQYQKNALASLLNRRLRQDRESVSAALSKWVRVTLFQLAGDDANANASESQLEGDPVSFDEREGVLEDSKSAIEKQLHESKRNEGELRSELSRLQDEKQEMTNQLGAVRARVTFEGSAKSDQLRSSDEKKDASFSDRESEVERKESALRQREQDVFAKENDSSVRSEEFGSTNSRLRQMANQLREKERDLQRREENLASELAKCEHRQSRLKQMATQLQLKAEELARDRKSLTKRMEDCDNLECQLQNWQTQLESLDVGRYE
jgi:chromosome segregation ATPase